MLRNARIGDRAMVTVDTEDKGRVGTIVRAAGSGYDIAGAVESFWLEFDGDASGPYKYDDNDLDPP
jgi:hypothetical protein